MSSAPDLAATFVVPTFNRARYIAECLESIRGQRATKHSTVVVDDCSRDDTRDVVERLGLPNLRYIANDRNLGASESRNLAIRLAPGEILVFVDSDDRLHPEHLERIREVFTREPLAGIVCCDSRIIDETGAVMHQGESFQTLEAARKSYRLQAGPRSFEQIFAFPTSFPGTTIRKHVLERVGGFDQSIFPLDDVDLQLRTAAAGIGIYYVDEILADYRTHGESQSAGMGRAVRTCQKKLECLERWSARAETLASRRVKRRRLADVHLELAISAWQQRTPGLAMREFVAAASTDPVAIGTFLRWRLGRRSTTGRGR